VRDGNVPFKIIYMYCMYWLRLVVTTLALKASKVGGVTMVAGSWFQM